MPDQEILIDTSPGETRAAILSEGRLDEVLIERLGQPGLVGAIVLAPVTDVRRELGAVFLDLGESAGYLDRFSGPLPNQGATVLVEVTAEPHRAKAARVTTDVGLHGAYISMTPTRPGHAVARAIAAKGERRRLREAVLQAVPEDIGVLVHAHARGCDDEALKADARTLMDRWSRIQSLAARKADSPGFQILEAAPGPRAAALRIAPNAIVLEGRDGALFQERDIDAEIARATERRVDLVSGAALVIDETEALVAIDIDTARARGALDNPAAFANEVGTETARQIRLRRLAGLIVIDFPRGGSNDARPPLVAALERAFAGNSNQPIIHGWTRGGLLELTRQRRGPSLREIMRAGDQDAAFNVTTSALEALRRVSRETSGIAHPRLLCPNPVKLALQGPLRPALDEVGRRLGAPLTLEIRVGTNEIEITGD